MIARTFRLLIELVPDKGDVSIERVVPRITVAVSNVAKTLGAKAVELSPDSPLKFVLNGEFPEGFKILGPRLLSYDFLVDGDPDSFAKRFATEFENQELEELGLKEVRVAPDPALRPALWTGAGTFDTRSDLLSLIGAGQPPEGYQRVNVVIVDQGFDKRLFPANYAGGIDVGSQRAGEGRSTHSAMIARNVISIAPAARLYDCPLIPTPPLGAPAAIEDIVTFTAAAADLCRRVAIPLVLLSNVRHFGTWVFVNAWALFDRRSDIGPRHYADDPEHPLNKAVSKLDSVGADILFAAGNCGQFDPDRRCDSGVLGPCRSILGANSLQSVLTVGAVRADLVPFGFTSQGPGQPLLGSAKPDLCAPAQFAERADRLVVSSGTSGATALAAGVVAALRSRWLATSVPPQALRDILTLTVRPLPPFGQTQGIGAGLINLGAAATRLQQQFP